MLMLLKLSVLHRYLDVFHDMRFPTMWYLTSVDSDEPVQPPFKAAYSVTMNIFRKIFFSF